MIRLDLLHRFELLGDPSAQTPLLAIAEEAERASEGPGAACAYTWGFSALQLFRKAAADVEPGEPLWPQHAADDNVYLNAGAWELPVAADFASATEEKRITAATVHHLRRVPGASLLVRLVPAPRSPDGVRLLSTE